MENLNRLDLRPGDLVEVRGGDEILASLDEDGALEGLPFMPEMLPYCGKRFRVFRRMEKTCVEGTEEGILEFRSNDVVLLEGLRCSGADHDGCGRSCVLFWKEAWLRRAEIAEGGDPPVPAPALGGEGRLATRLRSKDGERYFCQSTELPRATVPLPPWKRLWKCVRDVHVGTRTAPEMIGLVVRPLLGKLVHRGSARVPKTTRSQTHSGGLALCPGDLVEVKSIEEIAETLDASGRNRGLQFSYDLAPHCGRRYRVMKRLEHMILEGDGRMLNVKNTVLLDGVICPCKLVIGGCPRADPIYWREIWLRPVPEEEGASEPLPLVAPCSQRQATAEATPSVSV
jgi:hypothetical protein